MRVRCLHLGALLMTLAGAPAAEVVHWDDLVDGLRSGGHGPYAVYLGSSGNRLPRRLAAGVIPTSKVPVVMVAAGDLVRSPLSGRAMAGAKLQAFFGATAGTVLFLDAEGMPIPQLSIPEAMHGDDEELFTLYFSYVGEGHYLRMSIADYCRALGKEAVVERAVQRMRAGFAGRELRPDEQLVPGVNAKTSAPIDPWQEPGVFSIYSSSARGRVFLAQLAEIQHVFGLLGPSITLYVPEGEEPDLTAIPASARCVLAHASKAAIQAQGPSPMLVITSTATTGRRGMRLHGFQPGDVLGKLVGLPITDLDRVNRDIPYAEVDADGPEAVTAKRTSAPAANTPVTTGIMQGGAP